MADRKEDWEVSYIDSDGTFVGPVSGAVIFPTTDPLIVGAWWNDGGTLTISAA